MLVLGSSAKHQAEVVGSLLPWLYFWPNSQHAFSKDVLGYIHFVMCLYEHTMPSVCENPEGVEFSESFYIKPETKLAQLA